MQTLEPKGFLPERANTRFMPVKLLSAPCAWAAFQGCFGDGPSDIEISLM